MFYVWAHINWSSAIANKVPLRGHPCLRPQRMPICWSGRRCGRWSCSNRRTTRRGVPASVGRPPYLNDVTHPLMAQRARPERSRATSCLAGVVCALCEEATAAPAMSMTLSPNNPYLLHPWWLPATIFSATMDNSTRVTVAIRGQLCGTLFERNRWQLGVPPMHPRRVIVVFLLGDPNHVGSRWSSKEVEILASPPLRCCRESGGARRAPSPRSRRGLGLKGVSPPRPNQACVAAKSNLYVRLLLGVGEDVRRGLLLRFPACALAPPGVRRPATPNCPSAHSSKIGFPAPS